MASFRNVSADLLFVSDVGRTVEPDELLEVDGEVTSETDDAYITTSERGERAWPKAVWSDVGRPTAAVSSRPSRDEE